MLGFMPADASEVVAETWGAVLCKMAVAEELTTAAVDELPVRVNGLLLALLIRTGSRGSGALKTGVFVEKVVGVDTEDAVRGTFPEQIVGVYPPLHSLLQLLQPPPVVLLLYIPSPRSPTPNVQPLYLLTSLIFFFIAVIASTIINTTTTSIIQLIFIQFPESIACERYSHRLHGVHTTCLTLQPYFWPFGCALVACCILLCVEGGCVDVRACRTLVDKIAFDGSVQRVADTEGISADVRDESGIIVEYWDLAGGG